MAHIKQRVVRSEKGTSSYFNSHVGVCENHVELIIRHSKLSPQLCDQVLVHEVLLTENLHGLVIL